MSDLDCDLYRSCKKRDWGRRGSSEQAYAKNFRDKEGAGSLHPNYGFKRGDGSFRPSDVTVFDKDGESWVHGVEDRMGNGKPWVSWKEGVSVGKSKGVMPYASGWFDFLLPQGTKVPSALDVKATPSHSNKDHYSIRLRNQMTRDAYHGALDALARNAIARAVELGVPSFTFS